MLSPPPSRSLVYFKVRFPKSAGGALTSFFGGGHLYFFPRMNNQKNTHLQVRLGWLHHVDCQQFLREPSNRLADHVCDPVRRICRSVVLFAADTRVCTFCALARARAPSSTHYTTMKPPISPVFRYLIRPCSPDGIPPVFRYLIRPW